MRVVVFTVMGPAQVLGAGPAQHTLVTIMANTNNHQLLGRKLLSIIRCTTSTCGLQSGKTRVWCSWQAIRGRLSGLPKSD